MTPDGSTLNTWTEYDMPQSTWKEVGDLKTASTPPFFNTSSYQEIKTKPETRPSIQVMSLLARHRNQDGNVGNTNERPESVVRKASVLQPVLGHCPGIRMSPVIMARAKQ